MPDQIIREIPLIKRYSRHNENEDFRFRTFLKVELDMSNKQLDAVVLETTDEVWKHIDCKTCANCCRTLQIEVDNADIVRLAGHKSMTVSQFKRQYTAVAEDKTLHFVSTPCPFLGEDNLCSVYEDRPKACRDFPFLHGENFRSRTLGVIEHTSDCPIVFNVWQALKKRFKRGRRS